MPVKSVGTIPVRGSEAAPTAAAPTAAAPAEPAPTAAAPAEPAPELAAKPADGPVGHGVTRLKPRPGAHALHQPFIPGTPPPKGETAGAHGAHKGRISIR
jgi:hypothetical protein